MFDFFKKATKKQKKVYITIAACLLAVVLLVELVGMIPGIPFNGWSTILEACGLKQGYLVPEGELEVHFIDVGNADCILVRQGEHNMLLTPAISVHTTILWTTSIGITLRNSTW